MLSPSSQTFTVFSKYHMYSLTDTICSDVQLQVIPTIKVTYLLSEAFASEARVYLLDSKLNFSLILRIRNLSNSLI